MKKQTWLKYLGLVILSCLGVNAAEKQFVSPGGNIALGKTSTFLVEPNYPLCTDENDAVQLTDGKFGKGTFWWDKGTVGWKKVEEPVGFVVDLGKTEPIRGVMYSTVAGQSQITFPHFIYIYTSEDGKEWHQACDLVKQSNKEFGKPMSDIFYLHKYATLKLQTKGRYVAFVMKSKEYCFIDEIEIYRGDNEWLSKPAPGLVVTDLLKEHSRNLSPYQKRILNDLEALPKLPEFASKIAEIEKAVDAMDSFDCKKMKTLFPMSNLQREIFAMNSVALKNAGFTKPVIWRNNRWDNLAPMSIPPSKDEPAPLSVEMIRNEVRGETFNILNPTGAPQKFTVTVRGLPADANVDCREVLFSDTKLSEAVSSALKPGNGTSVEIEIPAGTNGQVWISFKRPKCKAGTYNGMVTAIGPAELSIPISLTIYDIDFPERPRVHVGGWDYTEEKANFYGLGNYLDMNMKFMRDIYVDSPWAHRNVAPSGEEFDADGHLVNEDKLDYTEWERWTTLWKDARMYCIFMAVAGINNDKDASWHGEPTDTPRFKTMVAEYFQAWARYLVKHNISPSRIVMLLIDEPWEGAGKDTRLVPWAKAIKAAVPEFKIFNDPVFRDVSKCNPELFEYSDIICPNTPHINKNNQREFFIGERKKGHELWLYSCNGPARLLDPVTYYRAQYWRAFEMGATGGFYWAMGSGGWGVGAFNAYSQSTDYSPYMAGRDGVFMETKQYEGLREGVQDYEYLSMLRDRIAELKKAGHDMSEAEAFIATVATRGLVEIKPKDADWAQDFNINWNDEKDRSTVDKVRLEVLHLLDKLMQMK